MLNLKLRADAMTFAHGKSIKAIFVSVSTEKMSDDMHG